MTVALTEVGVFDIRRSTLCRWSRTSRHRFVGRFTGTPEPNPATGVRLEMGPTWPRSGRAAPQEPGSYTLWLPMVIEVFRAP